MADDGHLEGTKGDTGSENEDALTRLGCALAPLVFVVAGSIFLVFYFSGMATKRGNPIVGLVFGIVAILVGVIGIAALVGGGGKKR